MRILSFITILAVPAILVSCKKDLRPEPLSFNVTTANSTYHTGDTVRFIFSGNPDVITFYSGEPGKNYEFKDKDDPDRGVAIKDISQRLDNFSYTYLTPGAYKVVFTAVNVAGTKQVSTLKEVDITVQ
jgi:hypothetical protein